MSMLTGEDLARPAKDLPLKVIRSLGHMLHQARCTSGDWEMIAEDLGFSYEEIKRLATLASLKQEVTPGELMLRDWVQRGNGRTLFVLHNSLMKAERQDCVEYLEVEIDKHIVCMELMVCVRPEAGGNVEHLRVRTRPQANLLDSFQNILDQPVEVNYKLLDSGISWTRTKAQEFKGRQLMLVRKCENPGCMEQDPTIDSSGIDMHRLDSSATSQRNSANQIQDQFSYLRTSQSFISSSLTGISPMLTQTNNRSEPEFLTLNQASILDDAGTRNSSERGNTEPMECTESVARWNKTSTQTLPKSAMLSSGMPWADGTQGCRTSDVECNNLNNLNVKENFRPLPNTLNIPVGTNFVEPSKTVNKFTSEWLERKDSLQKMGKVNNLVETLARKEIASERKIKMDKDFKTTVYQCPNSDTNNSMDRDSDDSLTHQKQIVCSNDNIVTAVNADMAVLKAGEAQLEYSNNNNSSTIESLLDFESDIYNTQPQLEKDLSDSNAIENNVYTGKYNSKRDFLDNAQPEFEANIETCDLKKVDTDEAVYNIAMGIYNGNEAFLDNTHLKLKKDVDGLNGVEIDGEGIYNGNRALLNSTFSKLDRDGNGDIIDEPIYKSTEGIYNGDEAFQDSTPHELKEDNKGTHVPLGNKENQSILGQGNTDNFNETREYFDFNKYDQSISHNDTPHCEEHFEETEVGNMAVIEMKSQFGSTEAKTQHGPPHRCTSEAPSLSAVKRLKRERNTYESLQRGQSCPSDLYYERTLPFLDETQIVTLADVFSPQREDFRIEDFEKTDSINESIDFDSSAVIDILTSKRHSLPAVRHGETAKRSRLQRHTFHQGDNTAQSNEKSEQRPPMKLKESPPLPPRERLPSLSTNTVESAKTIRPNSEAVASVVPADGELAEPKQLERLDVGSKNRCSCKIVIGGKSSRPPLDNQLANDNLFTHYNTVLHGFPGWSLRETENTIEKTMRDALSSDGYYILWYMRNKKNLVISVRGELINYRVHTKVKDGSLCYYVTLAGYFENILQLLHHYKTKGVQAPGNLSGYRIPLRCPIYVQYEPRMVVSV